MKGLKQITMKVSSEFSNFERWWYQFLRSWLYWSSSQSWIAWAATLKKWRNGVICRTICSATISSHVGIRIGIQSPSYHWGQSSRGLKGPHDNFTKVKKTIKLKISQWIKVRINALPAKRLTLFLRRTAPVKAKSASFHSAWTTSKSSGIFESHLWQLKSLGLLRLSL